MRKTHRAGFDPAIAGLTRSPKTRDRKPIITVILSRADPDRSIYRFTGVSRVEEQIIVLTSNIACRNSVPSGGKLSSRERSRSFGVVTGGGVVGGMEVGMRRVERIVIGKSG
jgi:hypothetical protein